MIDYYKEKKVLITGHTGFKGTWLSVLLCNAGANVTGYSIGRTDNIDFYGMTGAEKEMRDIEGDIRDLERVKSVFNMAKPEIVIHMAAQPLVIEGYNDPVKTYSTNVMGTLNVLEAARNCDSVKSILNVTTDKVYFNDERNIGFKEDDMLDGIDPYSNSKSCSELITHCYNNSFFRDKNIAVSTARAGNVIGGGDFSDNRIIPDCVRAVIKKENIIVRNPYSTRPYQHVLEALNAYLMILAGNTPGYYNVGPDDSDCCETGKLVDLFVKYWGENAFWESKYEGGPHEAGFLKLNSTKLRNTFGWKPKWNMERAVEKTVEWYRAWNNGENIRGIMDRQIEEFLNK